MGTIRPSKNGQIDAVIPASPLGLGQPQVHPSFVLHGSQRGHRRGEGVATELPQVTTHETLPCSPKSKKTHPFSGMVLCEALPATPPSMFLPWRWIQGDTERNCKKTNQHQPFSILLSFLNAQGCTGTQMTLPVLPHPTTFQILVTLCFISGTHLGKDRLSIIVCAAPSQLPR